MKLSYGVAICLLSEVLYGFSVTAEKTFLQKFHHRAHLAACSSPFGRKFAESKRAKYAIRCNEPSCADRLDRDNGYLLEVHGAATDSNKTALERLNTKQAVEIARSMSRTSTTILLKQTTMPIKGYRQLWSLFQ